MNKNKICTIKLNEFELQHLEEITQKFNLKNRSEAIRKCIDVALYTEKYIYDFEEINNKINRLIHNSTLTRKLLEQFFANTGL